MPTLEEVRARMRKEEKSKSGLPSNYYRYFDLQDGESATIRFLPDKNEENPFGFFIEKFTHTLEINGQKKSVPCLTQYGEECPICKVANAYYKEGDRVRGAAYYKRRGYISQALIVEDPLAPDAETTRNSEGLVRLLALSRQLFEAIKAEIEDPQGLEVEPWDYKNGTDFVIRRGRQGQHASYAQSRFARKSRPLTAHERRVVEEQMIDLSTLIPENPGLDAIEKLLESPVPWIKSPYTKND